MLSYAAMLKIYVKADPFEYILSFLFFLDKEVGQSGAHSDVN